MGCGNCGCGHNHHGKTSGRSSSAWMVGLALVLIAGVVGAAVVMEPPAAPAPAPTAPATTKPAAPVEQPAGDPGKPVAAAPVSPYVLGYTMKRIDGTEESLETYKGKVVMIVNVASKCGLTKQYEGLESLYKAKKDSGLVILGFPANNFGNQEPGSNSEIAEFCRSKYQVSFPMFEKISVKGDDVHPLFKQLASQPAPLGAEPDWNFTKYLVDRQGNVVAHFKARTKPDDAALTAKIEALLAAK